MAEEKVSVEAMMQKIRRKHKKSFLFLIITLAIVVGGYVIFKTPSQATQANFKPTASTTNHAQITEVEYQALPVDLQEYFDPAHPPRELVDDEQNGKAELSINVIYAIDKDRVFLGGSLFFPQGGDAQRSVLLLSSDGGMHWTEVMHTTRVSSVEHIVFLGQGQGWALVAGTGELGASWPVMLWHTTDFGETWEIAGKIHTGTGTTSSHLALRFFSSTHGEIQEAGLNKLDMSEGDYYSILSTQDGGISWRESYHLSLPVVDSDLWHDKRLIAFMLPKGGYYGSHAGGCTNIQECPSYGQDGSEWQAEYSEDWTNLFVRRRSPFENEWVTFILPACVEYNQGEIIGACKDYP
jgi:hypothetical protein